ncbi:MAG: hypothetical protein ACM31C_04605 [Acidobacteriota bacterium]
MRALWLLVAACGTDPGITGARSCWSAWQTGTIRFAPPALLDAVSSPSYDRDPSLTADELVMYVSSTRSPSTSDDLWVATRATRDDAWSAPELDTALSSPASETKISFTADGLYAVLGSSRDGGTGALDVWETTRASTTDAWATPVQTSMAAVNTVYDDHDPEISADGLHLYLAPSAPGLQHLVVAARGALDEPFAAPAPLLELDSGSGDSDPTVSPDETVIVFSSQRGGAGYGGGNLWYAARAAPGEPFGAPQPVPDVNGARDEGDGHLTSDGCTLYFASDAGTSWDIYTAAAR